MIINSQLGGKKPSGTKQIITNGVHDVADYASADVQVPTTAPAHYIEKTVDANGKLINSTNIINLNGVTDVGDSVLYYAYYQNTGISGAVDMSDLTTISGSNACQYMFYGCTGLTSVDLSGLTTVTGSEGCRYMFQNCSNITSVDLSGLTTVTGLYGTANMFSHCSNLINVDISSLTEISGYGRITQMFEYCSKLESIIFNSLTTISASNNPLGQILRNCSLLKSISFPALKSTSVLDASALYNMITGVIGCTIHFPSNLDPQGGSTVISSLTGYPDFGGTNTTLAFDLPATE